MTEKTEPEMWVEDTSLPVRPASENGQLFWNECSIMFLYAPSFDFARLDGASEYHFEILDDIHTVHTFTADTPCAPLSPVWNRLPPGITTVTVRGLDRDGRILGLSGRRTFWRKAGFRPGTYPPAKRGYGQTAEMILRYIFSTPEVQSLGADTPEIHFWYPSKMLSAIIHASARRIKQTPETAGEGLRILRAAADYLISASPKAGSLLEGFAPTYSTGGLRPDWDNTTMLIYPAEAASAYLSAWRATGEDKYLRAAIRTGDTYIRLQGEDGSWPLRYSLPTETPLGENRCMTLPHVEMFEALYAATGDIRYREAGDRAFRFVENGPLRTWNWEGQFEDTPPTTPYQNLAVHEACSAGLHLLRRYPGNRDKLALSRELLRFAEDQFVNWEKPFSGGRVLKPEKGFYDHFWDQELWIMPSVFEQYGCYTPVDSAAAKLIRLYLALYRARRDPIDLAKARTLADMITQMTDEDGLESTWWNSREHRQDIWPNCMLACETALEELDSFLHCCQENK